MACREAWGAWGCQVLKETGELWDPQVYQEGQASQDFTVSTEIRESQVIRKVQGQDSQDQRENQDCQVMWGGKEKEGPLVHLDTPGLLDLTEPLDILEAPDTQEGRVPMAIWGLKESKASRAFQERKALQVLQDSQEILDRWV